MKILLLGKTGQMGQALQQPLSLLGEVVTLDRQAVDLRQVDKLRHCIRSYRPHVIVNAAAYTAVDQAESEPQQVYSINAEAVSVLAEEVARVGAWLVHYSTDYVFDGTQAGAYTETDPTVPLNVYGQSKLAGEQAVQQSGCQHLMVRTGWLYAVQGSNFPLTILRRACAGERIEVVDDVWGAPTPASWVAGATAFALYRVLTDPQVADVATGIYHVVASGQTTWYAYAHYLINRAQQKGLPVKTTPEKVLPVSSDSYASVAKRPKNCRLDQTKWTKQFGLQMPDWKQGINQFMDVLTQRHPLKLIQGRR